MTAAYFEEHPTDPDKVIVRKPPHDVDLFWRAATTPEKWVGLTNNELQPIADEYRILFGSWVEDFARAIEAKLKEKNT
jgi:hypothetical protein